MKSYTSPHPVYVGSRYYKPGEVFATDGPVGADWTDVKDEPAEKPKAAAKA